MGGHTNMIKVLLFVLFFMLLAVGIGLTIWKGTQYGKSSSDGERNYALQEIKNEYERKMSWENRETKQKLREECEQKQKEYLETHPKQPVKGKVGFIAGLITSVVMLGLVVCIPGSFHQVETGTVAVVRELGRIVDVREPGTYFDFYMIRNYEIYDTKVQQDKIITAAYSKDGQTMDLEVFVQYQIQSENIMKIATEYGTLDALKSRIQTVTIEKTKAVMSSAEAMTIIQNRSEYSQLVSNTVKTAISQDYYVNVKDVYLTNIDFSDAFEAAVEDKVIAEQEKQAAITRAEAELEVAKLEAQRKIEEARGDAEAQKIIAQAEAEAATAKIIELARTLGYEINETFIYTTTIEVEKSNGYFSIKTSEKEFTEKQDEFTEVVVTHESVDSEQVTVTTTTEIKLTATEYTINIQSGPGADKFKELVEDYLAYLAYLEQWNGELPDVVAGSDGVSIIVPNGN
jgi:regulator of protease activity HflC (stomatin/prohibitin superfamily)